MNGLKHPLKELPFSLTILELNGWCEIQRTHSTVTPKHAIYKMTVCGQRRRKISLYSETSLNSPFLGKYVSNEPSFFQQTTMQPGRWGCFLCEHQSPKELLNCALTWQSCLLWMNFLSWGPRNAIWTIYLFSSGAILFLINGKRKGL